MPVIGVVGHHLLADTARLVAGVDEALDRIGARYAGQPLVLMSSLAEGMDRLVVRRALNRLRFDTFVVPMPFVRREFEAEFHPPGSLEEFRSLLARAHYVLQLPPPHGTPRAKAYAMARRFILDRAQVLLAVWDGTTGDCEDSTGELVALARNSRIPIAWVHAHRVANADIRDPGVRAPGSVTLEGWFDNAPRHVMKIVDD
jgi:hypothetical protein